MAATVASLKSEIAAYMQLANSAALTVSGVDLGLQGLNAARRFGEQAHEFKYLETNALLSIGNTGASLLNAYANASISVTGTLTPNIAAGSFVFAGTKNAQPFYVQTVSSTDYYLWWNGSTAWNITPSGFSIAGGSYWQFATTNASNPSGAYTPTTYTGTATITNATAGVNVKRVKYVQVPVASGDYETVEFLTNDQFLSRQRMQTGRQAFNSVKTLTMLGASGMVNPLAYQNAQTMYLSGLPLPITAQLNVVQWLPDYANDSDTDMFTLYGPEFLLWQGVIEVNKRFKVFTVRQEGDVEEDKVTALAGAALQSLIAWDTGVEGGTTALPNTPQSPPQPQAA